MASFGELISARRKELGWSQKELSEKVLKEDGKPISPQYLNDLERNRRDAPSDHLIQAFASILTIDVNLLFYSAGEFAPELRDRTDLDRVGRAIAAFRRTLEDSDGK